MTGPDPAEPDWLPGNEVEADLVTALAADDRRAFLDLVRRSPWYLPALPTEPDGQRFLTHDLLGVTYLLVFTSVRSLATTVGGMVQGYTITGYDELATRWPDSNWRLAVNPGTPVDAWLTLQALAEGAAGSRVVPTLAEAIVPVVGPADPATDAVLDDFLAGLNRIRFLVPVGGEPPRLLAARYQGQPVIEAFTSPKTLAERHPAGLPSVRAGLAELLAQWPGEGYALAVDPGSDTPLVVPGDQLPGLLLWAPDEQPGAERAASPHIAEAEYIEEHGRRPSAKGGDAGGASRLG